MKIICSKCGLDWEVSESVVIRKGKYICPYCTNKARVKKTILVIAGFIISCLLVPVLSQVADAQRGYHAYLGGENLIPFLYVAGVVLFKEIGGVVFDKSRQESDRKAC